MRGSLESPERLEPLCDRVLIELGVPHGFGQKGTQVPALTQFSNQVHGVSVHQFGVDKAGERPTADAVWTAREGATVGIVTADCVPILVSDTRGACVAAIHAGWRGLAEGVIEAGVQALSKPARELVAAVGPAARGCCYEIDAPVKEGLARDYSAQLEAVLEPSRPGHFLLDLPLLATRILEDLGIPSGQIGVEQRLCTICNGAQFESYRRDGSAAGRLRHFIGTRKRV